MEERDLKPVEALLRVAPAGKVKDIWPHHGPFYRPKSKEKPSARRKAETEAKKPVNKAHPTPEHVGEKIDFDV